jgi:hypothetical protein
MQFLLMRGGRCVLHAHIQVGMFKHHVNTHAVVIVQLVRINYH